jgi:hypothetical protein
LFSPMRRTGEIENCTSDSIFLGLNLVLHTCLIGSILLELHLQPSVTMFVVICLCSHRKLI